jgi:hypothetical protein
MSDLGSDFAIVAFTLALLELGQVLVRRFGRHHHDHHDHHDHEGLHDD